MDVSHVARSLRLSGSVVRIRHVHALPLPYFFSLRFYIFFGACVG